MKWKPVGIATACLLCVVGAERLYYFQNGGFSTSKLLSHLPAHEVIPPPEVDALLDQPFHFFGSGGTSFAFLGEDGKTVLKLFKHQHLFPKNPKKHAHKHHSFFFNSCRLAYDFLNEETGLIYLCLEPNPHFTKSVRLYDAWGMVHTLDLSRTEFALQRKAEPFFPTLERLLKTGQTEELKQALDALKHHIQARCRHGIGNRDPNLFINFGFLDGKVIEFDLGSFYLNPSLIESKEIFFSTYALQRWLEEHSPELLNYFLE